MADWREELGSIFQEAVKPLPLSPKNTLPQERIIGSSENDKWTGVTDDMGNRQYQTLDGRKYFVRPATQETLDARRSIPEKVTEWWDNGANLPSGEEVLGALAGMPQAYAETVGRLMDGTGTYTDLLGSVGPTAAPGVVSRVGTALDPSVVSAMGATHKVPRYKQKPLILENSVVKGNSALEQPETFNDDGLLLPEAPKPDDTQFRPYGRNEVTGELLIPEEALYGEGHWGGLITVHDIARLALGQTDPITLLDAVHLPRTPQNISQLDSIVADFQNRPQFGDYTEFLRQNPEYTPFDVDEDWDITEDGFVDRPTIQFRDPLDEILSEMEIPPKGITGAQLLKELQDNPTVRMAQLRSQGILDRIDPAKRYNDPKVRSNRNEVEDLLLEGKYNVQAVPQNRYDSYQRQPVADKELNYVEYAINASKPDGGPTFRANRQHYQQDTLAHVRLSERQNPAGNYVLIEELQSDLLQQGFVDPNLTFEDFIKSEMKNPDLREDAGMFEVLRRIDPTEFNNYAKLDPMSAEAKAVRDGWDKEFGIFVEQAGDRLDGFVQEYHYRTKDNLTLPPIAKLEESVRLGLETAIAHAAQNGIERVVIPPFHRIVEQRFTKGSTDYDKAMDPKSGFYQTYVGAVNKVLKKLNEDMGVDVEVREFDLNYTALDARYKNDFEERFREQFVVGGFLADTVIKNEESFRKAYEAAQIPPRLRDSSQNTLARGFRIWKEQFNYSMENKFTEQVLAGKTFDEAFAKINQLNAPAPDTGLEINFSNAIKSGYDLTRPRFAEGGVVENTNPVPPGATPKEVADDVPIMASDGEYILPANVVRFIGLDKIEKMVEQAKMKLAELDQKGRIGGDTGEQDDLPFSPEELQRAPAGDTESVGAVPQMAEGGMVSDPNMQIDPATGLPLWLLQMQGQSQAPTPTPTVTAPPVASSTASTGPSVKRESDRDRGFQVGLTGTAQSVAKWSPAEFNKYASTRGNTGQALGSAVTAMVPFGGISARMRGNYLERAVPRGFDTMLETGRDLQGNPLTADQITELRTSYDRVKSTPKPRTGVMGAVRGLAEDSGLVRRREPTTEREPRRLRDVFSGGSSSSPKASGDGLVSRPDKKKQSGGQKTSINSTNGKTSSKKK